MIAKITRGVRAGDIAAYLHGPGKTAMHTYRDRDGAEPVGGIVIGGTLAMRGDTTGRWAAELGRRRPRARRSPSRSGRSPCAARPRTGR